jgi:hypothetical protein
MTLDRRRFLQLTAGGLAASLASLGSSACGRESGEDDERALAQPGLIEMLGAERVRRIGERYRSTVPSENSRAALRAAIAQSRRSGFLLRRLRHRSIEQQVRDDFAAGRTVVVDGWVLSATEARQCALFSLLSA